MSVDIGVSGNSETDFARELRIIFKISERCNLACPYCYFFFHEDQSYLEHPPVVPRTVVEALGRFLRHAAQDYGLRRITVGFHGGEPLLLKPHVLSRYCSILKEATAGVCELDFGLQTNGVLVSDTWIDVFAEHDIGVGVSMDGPRDIHDRNRIDHKGRGSHDAVVRGFKRLQAAAAAGRIPVPGLLCVIDPAHPARRIFDYFVDELGVENVNFLLPDLRHDDPVVTPDYAAGIARFLLDVVDAWAARGRRDLYVRFVRELFGAMLRDDFLADAIAFKEDYRNMLTVSSNGDIGPEDTLRALGPRFAKTGLNVHTNTLREVFASPVWQELGDARTRVPDACAQCSWWGLCKSGKPYNRFREANGFDNPSVFCRPLQASYARVFELLEKAGYSGPDIRRRLHDGRIAAGLPALAGEKVDA